MVILVNHGYNRCWKSWLASWLVHLMRFYSGNVDFHVAQKVVKNDLLSSGDIFRWYRRHLIDYTTVRLSKSRLTYIRCDILRRGAFCIWVINLEWTDKVEEKRRASSINRWWADVRYQRSHREMIVEVQYQRSGRSFIFILDPIHQERL